MNRQSTRRAVDHDFWMGRRQAARDYLKSAEDAVTLADAGANLAPAVSQMVLSAIAYSDAITAKRAQVVNSQDHAAAPKLLREILGNQLPNRQHGHYKRLLGEKDMVQYGVRLVLHRQAVALLDDLKEFAAWVEEQL
jgi:hypothetical protein